MTTTIPFIKHKREDDGGDYDDDDDDGGSDDDEREENHDGERIQGRQLRPRRIFLGVQLKDTVDTSSFSTHIMINKNLDCGKH